MTYPVWPLVLSLPTDETTQSPWNAGRSPLDSSPG
jgi:hypothetical protein